MKKRNILIGAVLAFGLVTAAIAQTITVPQVPPGGIHPTTDLIQVLPAGRPSAQSVYATPSQITGTFGYYKSAASSPATGFTYTWGQNVTYASFTPSGTLAAGYFTLAAAPSDGQRNCAFTTGTITAAYVAANTGQSVNAALSATSISANTGFCYIYSAANATWDRN